MSDNLLSVSRPGLPTVTDPATNVAGLWSDQVPVGFECASFGPQTPGFQQLIFKVDEPATVDRADCVSEPFAIAHWHAKKIELADETTGAARTDIRLTFIDPNGQTLSFVSGGIVDSFDRLRSIRGDGPYNPPLRVLVCPVQTRNKRTMLRLRPAD